jgi:hypothetical protein
MHRTDRHGVGGKVKGKIVASTVHAPILHLTRSTGKHFQYISITITGGKAPVIVIALSLWLSAT